MHSEPHWEFKKASVQKEPKMVYISAVASFVARVTLFEIYLFNLVQIYFNHW